jgi:hypothetical protein
MYRTWLTGMTGMITLVMAVVLMAHSAPAPRAQPHGGAGIAKSATKP